MSAATTPRAREDSTRPPLRVLFVCTGNSARSLLAEVLLREKGGPRFEVHSAGTVPAGVNPMTIRVLEQAGLPSEGLRSKSVAEFRDQHFDFVITLCDDARQTCPVFPGVHESYHWGYDDPSAVEGPDDVRLAAFGRTLTAIAGRVKQFVTVVRRAA